RVTINGGILARVTRNPLTQPIAAPVPRAPSKPAYQGRPALTKDADTMPARASWDPRDKSRPAPARTKVAPTARIPMTAVARRMLSQLFSDRKLGATAAKIADSPSRTATDSQRTAAWRRASNT